MENRWLTGLKYSNNKNLNFLHWLTSYTKPTLRGKRLNNHTPPNPASTKKSDYRSIESWLSLKWKSFLYFINRAVWRTAADRKAIKMLNLARTEINTFYLEFKENRNIYSLTLSPFQFPTLQIFKNPIWHNII